MMSTPIELSIVIPAYNEAAAIENTVNTCAEMADQVASSWEVIVVDDGSTDDTARCLQHLQQELPALVVKTHPQNRGIGHALHTLYQASRGHRVILLPADRQVRAEVVPALMQAGAHDAIVVGYRSQRCDAWLRRAAAWLYHVALRVVYGLRVRDVDCVKCYPGPWLRGFTPRTTSAFVEAEILIRAVRDGLTVEEVPVPHYPRETGVSTGGDFKVIWRAIREFWWFWWQEQRHTPEVGNTPLG